MKVVDEASFRKKMCIVYRKERKAILSSHVNLAKFIINILKQSKELQSKLMHGEKIGDCHKIFKKLYMAP